MKTDTAVILGVFAVVGILGVVAYKHIETADKRAAAEIAAIRESSEKAGKGGKSSFGDVVGAGIDAADALITKLKGFW